MTGGFNGKSPCIAGSCFVAKNAVVAGDVEIGRDTSIWFGVVIRGDEAQIRIGEESNIQDNATVHVGEGIPAMIGSRVTVGHNAVVHGAVVEDDVLIGMHSVVLNGARIGRGSIIGAGAVVLESTEIPPYSLVVGIPGKVRGQIGEEQLKTDRG